MSLNSHHAAARRRVVRTILSLALGALLAAGAVFWANSIVADITYWQAEHRVATKVLDQ